jgi:N-acetylglucosamine malate deacetylase 2
MDMLDTRTLRNTNFVREDGESDRFLALLADPARPSVPAHDVAVVVAHPDDETIGCGAQLARLLGATVVLLTDGAPRKASIAQEHGCASVYAYGAARAREFCDAMELAGVDKSNILEFGFSDQTGALRLVELARAVYCLVEARRIRTVLTHAYEGGHPDHDAASFAVHAAAELKRRIDEPFSIVEMPLYRASTNNNWCMQSFADHPTATAVTVRLTESEQRRKRAMVAAYGTQSETLAPFGLDRESFRSAPHYDFGSLPNDGLLLYERYDWGMTGGRWVGLVRAALHELALRDPPWL